MGLLDMMGQGDSGFANWLDPRRNFLQQTFAGMVGQDNLKGALRGASQGAVQGGQFDTIANQAREEKAQQQGQLNRTVEFLSQNNAADLVPLVEAGQADLALRQYFERTNPQGGATMGLTPIWGTDAAGNPVLGQMSNQGGIQPVEMPEGMTFGKDPIRIDAGTHTVLLDPVTRQQIGMVPKNNEQAAYESAFGSEAGQAAASRIMELPQTVATADNMLGTIDGILNDPALDYSTGWLAWMQNAPGTDQYRFGQRALQLQGQAFLQAFESLKGGGQITEVEGNKATQAIGRLSTAQSPTDYRNALSELKGIIEAAKQRAISNAESVRGGTAPMPGVVTPDPGGVVDYTDFF